MQGEDQLVGCGDVVIAGGPGLGKGPKPPARHTLGEGGSQQQASLGPSQWAPHPHPLPTSHM